MKKLIVGALATLMLAGTVTAAFAFTSQDVSDSPETTVQGLSTGAIHYEVPEEATQEEQFRITWGLPPAEASATAMPKDEARQIGLDLLIQFFGVNFDQLGDYQVEMDYMPAFDLREISTTIYEFDGVDGRIPVENSEVPDIRWPMNVYRSTWHGTISVPTDRTPCPEGRMLRGSDLLRFRVDAQTGELIGLQFFPSEDPVTRPDMQSECMGSPIQVFEYRDNMTAQHNIEYANFAMQLAEEANIFEDEVLRAAYIFGGWMMGRDGSFELRIAVAVECVNGETVVLEFQGRNRKELVGVDFYSRMIDHAVDRDGNIVEPASQFVGFSSTSEITNWVYR